MELSCDVADSYSAKGTKNGPHIIQMLALTASFITIIDLSRTMNATYLQACYTLHAPKALNKHIQW
jgi:hypothetical protein